RAVPLWRADRRQRRGQHPAYLQWWWWDAHDLWPGDAHHHFRGGHELTEYNAQRPQRDARIFRERHAPLAIGDRTRWDDQSRLSQLRHQWPLQSEWRYVQRQQQHANY